MKLLILVTVLSTLTSLAAKAMITAEEAKQVVRDFEGDQTLTFSKVSYNDNQSAIDDGYSDTLLRRYTLTSEADYRVMWTVDADAARVCGFYYKMKYIYDPDAPEPDFLTSHTEEQCKQIAYDFMSSHYPDFQNHNLIHLRSDKTDIGWEFDWAEQLSSGAITNNGTTIGVSPDNGSILYYLDVTHVDEDPITPQITSLEAINIAKNARGISVVETISDLYDLAFQKMGVVIWSFDITGWDQDSNYIICGFEINAVTGEVITMGDAEYESDENENPAEHTNLSEKTKTMYKSSLKKAGEKKWELDIQGHVFEMSAGDSFITDSKGEKIELSGKIEEKDGEVIVPADFLPNAAKHIGKKMKKNDESEGDGEEESEDGTSVGTMNGGAASGPFYYIAGAVLAGVLLGAIVKSRIAASRKRTTC